MSVKRFFVQHIKFDGVAYTKGTPIDTDEEYHIICSDTPKKFYPEAKDVVTKNWPGKDGLSVYVPQNAKINDFEWEVSFLYSGSRYDMRTNINNFVAYLYGRTSLVDPPHKYSARLAVYDDYLSEGYKDVRVASVEFGTWWDSPDCDDEAIAEFKVKFHVYDPSTVIIPQYENAHISDLSWT